MAKIQDRTATQAKVVERSHPTAKTFVGVGAVLFLLTAAEFGIVYVEGMQPLVLAGLAIFSVLKFILVVGYFMHLRWDGKLLTWVFAFGMILAVAIAIAQRYVNLA